jgi:hypothetical protein
VESSLALEGAKERVRRADEEIAFFVQTHMATIDGKTVYVDENSAARSRLDRELHLLQVERDEAFRFFSKCLQDYNACRPRPKHLEPAPAQR